ncbi:MAG: MerR family transcriptional regulator [Elusimicrobia bacterium]|nr:MerR family transcriptional regulator [Elusimicrobiota bacterium]
MDIILPDKEYFSIGEVSKIVNLPQYILRYWETEFTPLKPQRRESGHRKYTKKEIEQVLKIKDLLYNQKFTIDGARGALAEMRRQKNQQLALDLTSNSAAIELLKETKKTIQEIARLLK